MKAYKAYMDKISVSDALHRKLVSVATYAKPAHSQTITRRYAAAFACLAVVLLAVVIVPQLLPSALVFNKASGQLSADKNYIRGHFWQELTPDELQAVFPDLSDTHTVIATANFQCDGTLVNIDAHVASKSGFETYLQIAPGQVELDYVLSGQVQTSHVRETPVTAGYLETEPNSRGQRNVIYFASFQLSGLGYYLELGGAIADRNAFQEELSALVGQLIKHEAADLSVFRPVIPELREDRLSLDQAYDDADFGSYLPVMLPGGFVFEDALRFINQERNDLFVHWAKGMGYIDWRVSLLGDADKQRITSLEDTKNYDLSLYPIPRADSVPEELREIVDFPIFRSDELTLKAVQARAYQVADAGDESGDRMRFGVLFGDTLVEINVKGATPEAVFGVLQQIKN